MKRYRVLILDFDARATTLKLQIDLGWEEGVRQLWAENKMNIRAELVAQYGIIQAEEKIQNFIDLGASPISVIAFHNQFLRQIRSAYVIGAFYPALTAACALGERVLNRLIIHLRDDYRHTNEYKKVSRKDSFDHWDLPIKTLSNWKVLLPNVVESFRKLKEIRNRALHFNPETDTNDKELSHQAISRITSIIEDQFSGFGPQPWFIPGIAGAAYIKKDFEAQPFVKHIVIPSCVLVAPHHELETVNGGWVVKDEHQYEEREISDEEFAKLVGNSLSGP
jgi:hypothetical protein